MNNTRAVFENSPANPLSAWSRNNNMNNQIRQMEWSQGWSKKRDENRKAQLAKETEKVYEKCSISSNGDLINERYDESNSSSSSSSLSSSNNSISSNYSLNCFVSSLNNSSSSLSSSSNAKTIQDASVSQDSLCKKKVETVTNAKGQMRCILL